MVGPRASCVSLEEKAYVRNDASSEQDRCVLHSVRHDIDSCLKLALDVAATAPEVDDGRVRSLIATKQPVTSRTDQRLELRARIEPVTDPEGWADRSRRAVDEAG